MALVSRLDSEQQFLRNPGILLHLFPAPQRLPRRLLPMRPTPQAACPAYQRLSSFSATASAGTASGAPQLPSATARLRSSPRRFVRSTADSLKRRENSS